MSKLVRCKVCGYVIAESHLKDKCPVCGAPRGAFEPYTDPVSERRRRYLNLGVHPLVVHFPQAFATSLFVLSLTPLVLNNTLGDLFLSAEKIVSLFLPPFVIAAALAGFIDGRMRFKNVHRSQILKKKLVLAALLFVSTLATALLIWLKAVPDSGFSIAITVPAFVAFICSLILGPLGMKVTVPIIPGD
jgi:hypothetical protein